MIWDYLDGGAEDHLTLQDNLDAFTRWTFLPRVLTGNDTFNLKTQIAAQTLELPVYLSPVGITGIAHWTGDVAVAKAAESAGTRAVISTAASYTPEEVAEATSSDHFFQLYPWAQEGMGHRALTEQLIDRAHRSGYAAMFLTVDTAAAGKREGERRRGLGVPPTLTPMRVMDAATKPRWSVNALRRQRISARVLHETRSLRGGVRSADMVVRMMTPEMTWDDFAWIRSQWTRPVFVKGILHPDDAARAVDLGADGVVVSNHGGRQLDGSIASLDALPRVIERVGSQVPVYLDGGVRRGTDVVKALCLGASAVGIGRPYVWALAAQGQSGVENTLAILRDEIVRTLTLLGSAGIDDLRPDQLFHRISQRQAI